MNCSRYFAIAPSCPTSKEMDILDECNDVSCGEYCIANGTLPDGNSDYDIDNCESGGRNLSVYIHLCSGTTPSPTIATTEVETWHHERHGVFECVESHINITSPTVFTISTSADIEEATVQCLGACQSSEHM
jgi:hypothetical protein